MLPTRVLRRSRFCMSRAALAERLGTAQIDFAANICAGRTKSRQIAGRERPYPAKTTSGEGRPPRFGSGRGGSLGKRLGGSSCKGSAASIWGGAREGLDVRRRQEARLAPQGALGARILANIAPESAPRPKSAPGEPDIVSPSLGRVPVCDRTCQTGILTCSSLGQDLVVVPAPRRSRRSHIHEPQVTFEVDDDALVATECASWPICLRSQRVFLCATLFAFGSVLALIRLSHDTASGARISCGIPDALRIEGRVSSESPAGKKSGRPWITPYNRHPTESFGRLVWKFWAGLGFEDLYGPCAQGRLFNARSAPPQLESARTSHRCALKTGRVGTHSVCFDC